MTTRDELRLSQDGGQGGAGKDAPGRRLLLAARARWIESAGDVDVQNGGKL